MMYDVSLHGFEVFIIAAESKSKARYKAFVRYKEAYRYAKLLADAIAAWNRRASPWVSVETQLPEVGE